MNIIEGQLKLSEKHRIAILASRFNRFVVDGLVTGAVDTLKRHGLPESSLDVIWVPGAFELPLIAEQVAAMLTAIEFSARRREVERAECTLKYMSTRDERQQSRKFKCEEYTQKYHGIVAVGAIIRGATPHFEYIASACIQGLHQVSIKHKLPLGLGVLTTDTVEQAIERSGTKSGNKGSDAALTVIELIDLMSCASFS